MSKAPTKSSKRVLEPYERISEVLFGLIMVLTFTGSLSVANPGRADVRTMLVGALGCNLAWGKVSTDELLATDLVAGIRKVLVLGVLNGTLDEKEEKMFNVLKAQIESGKM